MTKIKGRIWGFRKKEVDDHINRLIKAQEMEFEDLTKTIERFQKDNEILRHEISTLTEKNISLPAWTQLELALKRVEKVAGYIDQDVGMEVLAIETITGQNSLLLDNTITEIDQDIESKKEIIEKELKNIVEIARGKEKTKNINIEVLKSIAKVLPIAEWLKNNRNEQTSFSSHFWKEEPTDRTPELVEQMTSDGTTLESTQKLDTTKAFSADLNSNCNDITKDVIIPDNVMILGCQENEETKDNGYSVLGSALQGGPEDDESFPTDTIADFRDADSKSPEIVNPSIEEVVATRDFEAEDPNHDIFQQVEAPKSQSKVISKEQLPTGVREDTSAVRDKNIIGRVAGEDITDSSGKIIIRKDDPITLNTMQRAKNGGKLTELIIQMVLPQQEE